MASHGRQLWHATFIEAVLAQWGQCSAVITAADAPSFRYWFAAMCLTLSKSRAPPEVRLHPAVTEVVHELRSAAARLMAAGTKENRALTSADMSDNELNVGLARPPTSAALRTIVPSLRTLVAAVPVMPDWLVLGLRKHADTHAAIEAMILGGNTAAAATARAKPLRRLLSRLRLVPADEASNSVTGHGVAYCMLTEPGRHNVLLQCVIADSVAAGPIPLSEVLSLLLALANTSSTLATQPMAYRFPSENEVSPAVRSVLVRLSDTGFIFPMKHDGQALFTVHSSLSGAVWALPSAEGGDSATRPPRAKAMSRDIAAEVRNHVAHVLHQPITSATDSAHQVSQQGIEALHELGRQKDLSGGVIRHRGTASYHPATTNTADGTAAGGAATWCAVSAHQDFIVTETNYRLYVYIASSATRPDALPQSTHTLLRLLDQFAERDLLVPRFAVYRLTRQRFLSAVSDGISQQQILTFLSSRSHPDTEARDSSGQYAMRGVPQSIADQLAMWEREARRVTVRDAASVMLVAPTTAAAERLVSLAEKGGGLLHRSALQVVVTSSVFETHIKPLLPAAAA